MTGNRRKQAQAVLFSLIMIVSMGGIGAAGFAGSAAADAPQESPTDSPGNLQVSLLNGSTGTVNATWGVNTTSGTINVTNGTETDTQVADITVDTDSAKAIQYAINNASAENDTVLVGSGTYNGSLSINATVNVNADGLTLEAAEGASPVIDAGDDENAIDILADDVTIRGFTVKGFTVGGIMDSSDNQDGTVLIEDNKVESPGETGSATVQPIQITGGDGSRVINNTVDMVPEFEGDEWASTGILADGTTNAEIRGNTVMSDEVGIGISSFYGNPPTNNTIEGNEISTNSSGRAVEISATGQNVEDTEVSNNIIENSDEGLNIVEYDDYSGIISGSTVSGNTFSGNGVHVDVSGGDVDLSTIQQGNTFDPDGMVDGNQIVPMTSE